MIRTSRRTYAGFTTRCLSVGPVGAPARVVLLHGFGDSAETWRSVFAELDQLGISALAADLPGFGQADTPGPGPVLPQLDRFVVDLLAAESEPGQVVLAGNSLGGALTLRAASNSEVHLRGAMPIDVAGLGLTPLVRRLLQLNGRLRVRPPVSESRRRLPLWVPGAALGWTGRRVAVRLLYADRQLADPVVVARMTSQISDLRSARALVGLGARIGLEVDAGFAGPHAATLSRVRCPLVIVHGRRDKIVPVSASERLHRAVPGSRLHIIDAAGHAPQLEQPHQIADLVVDLLH